MLDSKITTLELKNFKIHKSHKIDINKDIIALYGKNGSGKTTVLEAISLLSPGKGMLFSSNNNLNYIENITKDKQDHIVYPYNIDFTINDCISINISNKKNKFGFDKNIKINNKPATKQLDLLNWCDVLWFTAKMQYDLSSMSNRRNFFDRLTFCIFEDHAQLISSYKKLIKDRMEVLQSSPDNKKWLSALEHQISEIAVNIAQNRCNLVKYLNAESDYREKLTNINVIIEGDVENNIDDPLLVERFAKDLMDARFKDTKSNRTNNGIHKSSIKINNHEGENINLLSSGMQKMTFIGLIGLMSKIIFNHKKRRPILLFDEMVSFLDDDNMLNVINNLSKNLSQVWFTNCNKINLPFESMQEVYL